MESIEQINWNNQLLAIIIRAETNPEKTTFVTPEDFNFQLGFVVYPSGGEVTPHTHLPLERHIVGTSEVLLIKKGRCLVDIYDDNRELITSHGYRMLEDTTFLEIKQGPYTGSIDKERFSRKVEADSDRS